MTRGELLREASKINRSSSVLETDIKDTSRDATDNVLNDEKEATIAAKTNSAADFETRIGDHGGDTNSLIETLTNIRDEIVHEPHDVDLAGFSEACISVLLKHLDTSGKFIPIWYTFSSDKFGISLIGY